MKTTRRGFLAALGIAPLIPMLPKVLKAAEPRAPFPENMALSEINSGARAMEAMLGRNFDVYASDFGPLTLKIDGHPVKTIRWPDGHSAWAGDLVPGKTFVVDL